MAIIHTYPTKTTLALADKVLISDSADSNKTKTVKTGAARTNLYIDLLKGKEIGIICKIK